MITATELTSINPATLETVGALPIDDAAAVQDAVRRARAAQPAWAALPVSRRLDVLRRYQRLVVDRRQAIMTALCRETSKPKAEALVEVFAVLEMIRHYRGTAARQLAPQPVNPGLLLHKKAYKVYEPLGVIGVISPWNYPFLLPHTPIISALLAGNAVVFKPSELTPVIGKLVVDMLHEVLPDPNLVQFVVGPGDTGAALVGAGVDKIAFTGSVGTGKKIMAQAAETLTPVVMELGGKDPMIVCADADLERAAAGAVWAAFSNSGQTCMAVERCYVVESVADAFIAKVVEKTKALRQGARGEVDLGSMISERQRSNVSRHVQEAVAQGATVLAGGKEGKEGYAYEPTVLVNVTQQMAVMTEETFGPVLPIMRVPDEATAVKLANDTPFGLTASVWTKRQHKGERIAAQLRAGVVCVNDHLVNYGITSLPFGGVGQSGFGRMHGSEGLLEMVQVKSVVVDRLGLPKEFYWFPYSAKVMDTVEWMVGMFYR